MKALTVGFSSHRGALSWLIRALTKSKVSHTYLRIPVPEYETTMIFQASGLLVNYCSADVFAANNRIAEEYEVEVSDEQWLESERRRVEESGKRYSSTQLVGYLWILFMRKLGRKVDNPFADGDHAYVCVEVVAKAIGLKDSESMTQEDLRRWCEKNGRLIPR